MPGSGTSGEDREVRVLEEVFLPFFKQQPQVRCLLSDTCEALSHLSKELSFSLRFKESTVPWDDLAALNKILAGWNVEISDFANNEAALTGIDSVNKLAFWKSKLGRYRAVYDELNREPVKRVIQLCDEARTPAVSDFEVIVRDNLAEKTREISENIKFLQIIDRHMALIRESELSDLCESLPSLVKICRFISNFRSAGASGLTNIFESVEREIRKAVLKKTELKTLFTAPRAQSLFVLGSAVKLIDTWNQCIVESRRSADNEESRWGIVSGKSELNFIRKILLSLREVLQTLAELERLVGSLKKTGLFSDSIQRQVQNLASNFAKMPFSCYNRRYYSSFEQMMKTFRKSAKDTEETISKAVAMQFRYVRDPLVSFFLLLKYVGKWESDAFSNQWLDVYGGMYSALLVAFHEVAGNKGLLMTSSRQRLSLFQAMQHAYARCKSQILAMKTASESTDATAFAVVLDTYVAYAAAHYRKRQHFGSLWQALTSAQVHRFLKSPLLVQDSDSSMALISYGLEELNNSHACRAMLSSGVTLSEDTKMSLLEHEKIMSRAADLFALVKTYNQLRRDLTPTEARILEEPLVKLSDSIFRKSERSLNWTSLGLEDFFLKSDRLLRQARQLRTAVRRNLSSLDRSLNSISRVEIDFFGAAGMLSARPSSKDLFAALNSALTSAFDEVEHKLQKLPETLKKVEEAVLLTSSGSAKKLGFLYETVEVRVFASVLQFIRFNLYRFADFLADSIAYSSHPLLVIKMMVFGEEEVVESISRAELRAKFATYLHSFVQETSRLQRWVRDTCLPLDCKLQDAPNYTYLSDVNQVEEIAIIQREVLSSVDYTLSQCYSASDKWRSRISDFSLDAQSLTAEFSQQSIAEVHQLARKIQDRVKFLSDYEQTLKSQDDTQQCSFVLLDFYSVKSTIISTVVSLKDAMQRRFEAALNELVEDKIDTLLEQYKALRGTFTTEEEFRGYYRILRTVLSDESYLDIYRLRQAAKSISLSREHKENLDELHRIDLESKSLAQQLVYRQALPVDDLQDDFLKNGPLAHSCSSIEDAQAMFLQFSERLRTVSEAVSHTENDIRLFRLPSCLSCEHLLSVKTQLNHAEQLLRLNRSFSEVLAHHGGDKWVSLDCPVVSAALSKIRRDMDTFFAELGPKELAADSALAGCITVEIETVEKITDMLAKLQEANLSARHYCAIQDLCPPLLDEGPFDTLSVFVVYRAIKGMYVQNPQFTLFEDVNTVIAKAQREQKLQDALDQMDKKWSAVGAPLARWNNVDILNLEEVDDLLMELEDATLQISAIANSEESAAFHETVTSWEFRLGEATTLLSKSWPSVQTKWQYLNGIFSSEEIQNQLVSTTERFQTVCDLKFKDMMKQAVSDANILRLACSTFNTDFRQIHADLETCEKELSTFLESRRAAFPRFYISVPDSDLVAILGACRSGDIEELQPFISRCFANCRCVRVDEQKRVLGMESVEGELLEFFKPIAWSRDTSERLFNLIEAEMRRAVRFRVKEAIYTHGTTADYFEWLDESLLMTAILSCQVWWTVRTTEAFRRVQAGSKYALSRFAKFMNNRVNSLIEKVRDPGTSRSMRTKLNTMTIIEVHQRDIVEQFVRESIFDPTNFAWESQLRFYFDRHNDQVQIRQASANLGFGYEYHGQSGRLVITPLTDRCVLTMTQAMSFFMGSAPAGPAGTGKTETVKDLSRTLGRLCSVTNCGEGLDQQAMGAIFTGLVQVGAFGCFDEINRLDVSVLSVVASQLRSIFRALKEKREQFEFIGKQIKPNPLFGIAVTMNPGYAGRTELPENLKALFRPITMVVPDRAIICEIILMSQGFASARDLANRLVSLYNLSDQTLAKRIFYDWGLRSLKSVLQEAGEIRRATAVSDVDGETRALLVALQRQIFPKFPPIDRKVFTGLVNDLFAVKGHTKRIESKQPTLQGVLEADFKHRVDSRTSQLQLSRIMALRDVMTARHSTVILGPTKSAKSVVIQKLASAMKAAFDTHVSITALNPKSISLPELYGVLNSTTREWKYGLLSHSFKKMNQLLRPGELVERWLLFDCDVDALWIENLNSVMDDSKLLTLPNGERLPLEAHCKLLFEVENLDYASPATVSRCGIIYCSADDISLSDWLDEWLKKEGTNWSESVTRTFVRVGQLLAEYLTKYSTPLGDFALAAEHLNMSVRTVTLLDQFCSMFERFVAQLDPDSRIESAVIESLCLNATILSVGQSLSNSQLLDLLVRIASERAQALLPDDDEFSPHDYYFSVDSHRWQKWSDRVTDDVVVHLTPTEYIVKTPEFLKAEHFMSLSLESGKSALLIGERGTSKTSYLSHCRNSLLHDRTVSKAKLMVDEDSLLLQRAIEACLEKRGVRYVPKRGEGVVLVVDDVNQPYVDTYGTRRAIAFLSFVCKYGIMYERGDDFDPIAVPNFKLVAAMDPSSREPVDSRFVSNFFVHNLAVPDDGSLSHILSTIISKEANQMQTDGKSVSKELLAVAHSLVDACVLIFKKLRPALRPTISDTTRFITISDIIQVQKSIWKMLVSMRDFDSQQSYVRLWHHELRRVISAKLSENDVFAFNSAAERSAAKWDKFLRTEEGVVNASAWFGNYQKEDSISECTRADCLKAMNGVLAELPGGRWKRHAAWIWWLRSSYMRKIACKFLKYRLYEVEKKKKYALADFIEDLRNVWKIAYERTTVFLLADSVLENDFIGVLDKHFLAEGCMPDDLYDEEEKQSIVDFVRISEGGTNLRFDAAWARFVKRINQNLRVLFVMSPSGDILRQRCRDYPELLRKCSVRRFVDWPDEALSTIAFNLFSHDFEEDEARLFARFALHVFSKASELSRQSSHMRFQFTAKNHLRFVHAFKSVLQQKSESNAQRTSRYCAGVEKIQQSANEVHSLKEKLSQSKIAVTQKSEECETVISELSVRRQQVETMQTTANEKQEELKKEAVVIQRCKQEAEDSLSAALPALEAAAEALRALQKEDITEIRALANPPLPVKLVLQCVLELKPSGTEDPSGGWAAARAMMADAQFIGKLRNYAKDEMTDRMYKNVQRILKRKTTNPKEELTLENLSFVSKAGAGMLAWVKSIVLYFEVAKDVAPRRAKVQEMETAMHQSQKSLRLIRKEIESLDAEVRTLESTLNSKNAELLELQEEAARTEKLLNTAQKLIAGFESENTRWSAEIATLGKLTTTTKGDALLSAAFLSYFGPFGKEHREQLLDQCKAFLTECDLQFSFDKAEDFLATELEKSNWKSSDLPQDSLSIQNAILSMQGTVFPLLVDPYGQALSWLVKAYGTQKLAVRSFDDSDFLRVLELSISFGNPMVIKMPPGDQEVDPLLNSILDREFVISESGQKQIKVGDSLVEYHAGFRLYLVTKEHAPVFSPEMTGKVNLINFCVTKPGLEEQLLGTTLGFEKPELQEKRQALVLTMSQNATVLAQLESILLSELNRAKGNILENQVLLETLEETKKRATSVKEQNEASIATANTLDELANKYRSVARRGAVLFFTLIDMPRLNEMYHYSLDSFRDLFLRSLGNAAASDDLSQRLSNIISTLTKGVFSQVCTASFPVHRLFYSFYLALQVAESLAMFPVPKLQAVYRLPVVRQWNEAEEALRSSLISSGLGEEVVDSLLELQQSCENFKRVIDDMAKNTATWKLWISSSTPLQELDGILMASGLRFDAVDRLLLVKIFHPQCFPATVNAFIETVLRDKQFIRPPTLDYAKVVNDCLPKVPVVFVLSSGADPQSELEKIAVARNISTAGKFHSVSLGQGMTEKATELLEQGAVRGYWVVLQNLHLVPRWLGTLAKKVSELKESSAIHDSFKLFLTTEPTSQFPTDILSNAVKVVVTPPITVRQNMNEVVARHATDDFMATCEHPKFRSIVYTLAYFHGILQRRRRFGKLGFCVDYGFNDSDFRTSLEIFSQQLQNEHTRGSDNVPWLALRQSLCTMYGGRITDAFDERILKAYVKEYFTPELLDESSDFVLGTTGDFVFAAPETGLPISQRMLLDMISRVPDDTKPMLLGLGPSSENSQLINEAQKVQEMARRLTTGVTMWDETATSGVESTVSALAEAIPSTLSRERLLPKSSDTAIPPLQTFLLNEVRQWNNLITEIKMTLQSLSEGLAGLRPLSEQMERAIQAIMSGQIPSEFLRFAPQTNRDLSGFIEQLSLRQKQYSEWLADEKLSTRCRRGIDVSLLHSPSGLISAILQARARFCGVSLDSLGMWTQIPAQLPADSSDTEFSEDEIEAVVLTGIQLEGASFRNNQLELDVTASTKLTSELPIIALVPMLQSQLKRRRHGTISIPVFRTRSRRNAMGEGLCFEIDLPTKVHSSSIRLSGAALLLEA
ncbi:MAG: hypothetical protein MHM6MM_004949 [Cercozoa sp. M6MM]